MSVVLLTADNHDGMSIYVIIYSRFFQRIYFKNQVCMPLNANATEI